MRIATSLGFRSIGGGVLTSLVCRGLLPESILEGVIEVLSEDGEDIEELTNNKGYDNWMS